MRLQSVFSPALGMVVGIALAVLAVTRARAEMIDTVTVGNAGNTPDITTGYGAVPYSYQIGKFEVTNAQYAAFLNAVDPDGTNPHYPYNSDMGDSQYGGISFNSSNPSGSKYSTIAGRGNLPVTSVTFWNACRFANWLNNGQGSADTETGAYTLTADGMANNTVVRNEGARWVVTSENEWYKAAYFDPNKMGGAGYWKFPTRSDAAPTGEAPPGTDTTNGSANYGQPGVTAVGAYTFSPSAYGTFDQAGNVSEWTEAILGGGADRGLRGGAFDSAQSLLDSSFTDLNDPEMLATVIYHGYDPEILINGVHIGFRVAYVPEPGSAVLLAAAGLGLLIFQRRRKVYAA